jgi:hypothetical protein
VSIRQRLYPEPGQVAGLAKHADDARFVFNIGLGQRSLWRRSKHDRGIHPEYGNLDAKKVTTATQMRELAELRKELDWLRAGSSSVQPAALRDLDRAFANFYAGRAAYPSFKRRDDRQGSFVIRDLTVRRLNRKWGVVTVPKVGVVRFRISRLWPDIERAGSARVTLRHQRRGQHPRPGTQQHCGRRTCGVRTRKPSTRWQRQPTSRIAAENPRTSVRGGCQRAKECVHRHTELPNGRQRDGHHILSVT